MKTIQLRSTPILNTTKWHNDMSVSIVTFSGLNYEGALQV